MMSKKNNMEYKMGEDGTAGVPSSLYFCNNRSTKD